MVAQSKISLVGISVLWLAIFGCQSSAATEAPPTEEKPATQPPEMTWTATEAPLLAATEPPTSVPPPGSIRGNVQVRYGDGTVEIVEGVNVTVTVELVNLSTKCDRLGNYAFHEVQAGLAVLEFSYSNYTVQKLPNITVEPGQEVRLEIFFLDASVPHIIPTGSCFPVASCGVHIDPHPPILKTK